VDVVGAALVVVVEVLVVAAGQTPVPVSHGTPEQQTLVGEHPSPVSVQQLHV